MDSGAGVVIHPTGAILPQTALVKLSTLKTKQNKNHKCKKGDWKEKGASKSRRETGNLLKASCTHVKLSKNKYRLYIKTKKSKRCIWKRILHAPSIQYHPDTKAQHHPAPKAPVVSPDSVLQVGLQRLCSHAASFIQTVRRLAHGWEGPQAY